MSAADAARAVVLSTIKRQKQAFLHKPEEGVYGDCYRTCIACLLGIDRDAVPHFYSTEDGRQSDQSLPIAGIVAADAWRNRPRR